MTCTVDSYYTINRNLLLCLGLWPYQRFDFRCILVPLMIITLVSGVIVQFASFATREYSMELLLKILAYSIPWMSYMFRYNIFCLNVKKMRDIMERVRLDWSELNNAREIEIIKKYSALGRFITLFTTLFIYLSTLTFILMQLMTNVILDIVTATNESHLRQFPVELELFIDQQKYFIPIMLYIFLVVLCGLTSMIAVETLFMSYSQHACGLFEIANCRIEQALHGGMARNVASVDEKNSIICHGIISAVNMHRKAIEFIEMMKGSFKWVYFIALPLNVLSLSINLYRLSRLIMSQDYQEIITTVLLVLGHFGYMFFCNYLGQDVIDHSSNIFHKTYNVQWYMTPSKVQKLLMLVMQRSMRYCTIMVAGLFVPSLEGFATLTSMSLSYFMVIYSTQ